MTLLVGVKVLVMHDDISSYKGLISAIITRAILDSVAPLINNHKKLSPLAQSGLDFLLSKDVGVYLDFLNIDIDYFQKNLVDSMFKDNINDHEFNATKKRMFRINYKKWVQEKNKKLIFMATYKVNRK
jgi:hypothetical protein